MKRTIELLTTGLVDYAGLFPPAKLDMGPAVEAYARHRMGPHAPMLARFVCPVSRLGDLTAKASMLMPGTFATSGYREHADVLDPWRISAIIDGGVDDDVDRILAFNEHHAIEDRGLAIVDAAEIRAVEPDTIDDTIDGFPESIRVFYEVPTDVDVRGYVAALAGGEACAKIRCGGVKAPMIPTVEAVASFIAACAQAGVTFKATAGLHHPIRGAYPLTYDPEPERAVMHGYVNVFIASAMARTLRLDDAALHPILACEDLRAFEFTDDSVRFGDLSIDAAQLASARESFALSYGSCSFDEPVDDLRAAGLL
ncbi:MAG: hypothetical protein KDA28_13945 [Phycisphaerales bacterium]|nr:hypothetical protein [Phycisphaerales bacterium]